jgi:hypothetical protein
MESLISSIAGFCMCHRITVSSACCNTSLVTLTTGALTHDKKWLLVGMFRFAMKRVLLKTFREKTEEDLLCLHEGLSAGHVTFHALVCGIEDYRRRYD